MQVSSKLLYKSAILLMGLLLVCGLVLVMNANKPANALSNSPGQWETVRVAINGFITNQYDKGPDGIAGTADDPAQGEAGFTVDRATLRSWLNSSGNPAVAPTQILGEGDNAVNAPVLVDNLLAGQATLIPGTSLRCNWASTYGVDNCLDTTKVATIATKVNAHKDAGFSTNIVLYCATARTESTATGALGPLAYTGALGGGSGVNAPKVLDYKWGRNGWTGTTTTTSAATGATGSVPAPSVIPGFATNPTPCNSYVSDADVVRCAAQYATYNGVGDPAWGGNGYNVSNGATALTSANQVIDVRSPSPASTITVAGAPTTLQIPAYTAFDNSATGGLQYIAQRTTATKNIFVGRTHMLPGIMAVGSVMLGYNSSNYVWGVNSWNTSLAGESYTGETPAYTLLTTTAGDKTTNIDSAAPTFNAGGLPSDPGNIVVTDTTATVRRVTNEPATSKLVITGLPDNNNTILNGDKTTSLTGLTPSTLYTGTLYVYDGQANVSNTPVSFTTNAPPCTPAKPALSIATHEAYWASFADYTARNVSVVLKVTAGAANAGNVNITGSVNTNGATLNTATPIALGTILSGATASTTVVYHVPAGVTQFNANVTGSALDACGTSYTYPL